MTIEYFESAYWPLIEALQLRQINVIIGGGMALYLRDLYLEPTERSPNYPPRSASRTTKDLDAFITEQIISEPSIFYQISEVLRSQDFEPVQKNKYWQWGAQPDKTGYYSVMVDFLAAPPRDLTLLAKPRDERRLSPKSAQPHTLHARRTDEAAGIEHSPLRLDLRDGRSLLIASSLNLIILKLAALHDQLARVEELLARKHALDLLKIVSDMREDDWAAAQAQLSVDGGAPYLMTARHQRVALFGSAQSPGALTLRDALARERLDAEWLEHLPRLIDDMRELLPAP